MTSGRWFSRRSRTTSQSEPTAPAFSSYAAEHQPIHARRAPTAPAHIVHGSRVTTRVQPVEPPLAPGRGGRAQGDDLGVAGGVAVALADVAAGADHLTGGARTTAPIGTSPVARPARASARAARIGLPAAQRLAGQGGS